MLVHDHETLPAGDNSQQLLIDIRVKLANDDFIRVIGVDGQLHCNLPSLLIML